MESFHHGYQHHLPKLDTIEEMIIARAYPVTKPWRCQNGILGYNKDAMNIKQGIQWLVSSLPSHVY
eukprot:10616396-Ditylum_brightwellii.AAC.1